jgi:hypothetical protein
MLTYKGASYRQRKKHSKTTSEESLLEIIKEKSRDDIDEDKYFYVSGAVFQKTV